MEPIIVKGLGLIKSKEEKELIKQIEKNHGKKSQKLNSINFNYVKGINKIDEEINHISSTSVYKYNNGILFKLLSSVDNKNAVFFISYDDVKNAYFADGEIIVKSKSVIKRGIAGAIIAGPVGSIVGAISGIGEVENQDNYLVVQTEGTKVIFKSKSNFVGLENHFKEVYRDKLMTINETKKKLEDEFLNNI